MTALRITLDGYLNVEEVRVYLRLLQTLGFGETCLLENTGTIGADTRLTAEIEVMDVDQSALAGLEDV